ncbi:uncharacterized protein VP01_6062g2, partial [Puccinia sorghi]
SQCTPFDPIGISPPQTSWSTSARLAACTAAQTPTKSLKELVAAPYHQYLPMFKKSSAQGLPPWSQYDFCVELLELFHIHFISSVPAHNNCQLAATAYYHLTSLIACSSYNNTIINSEPNFPPINHQLRLSLPP